MVHQFTSLELIAPIRLRLVGQIKSIVYNRLIDSRLLIVY